MNDFPMKILISFERGAIEKRIAKNKDDMIEKLREILDAEKISQITIRRHHDNFL